MSRSIAIAGLGDAATHIHLPAFKKLSGLRVVGGCDPVVPQGSFPFPVFTTVEELLTSTKPDILAIARPLEAEESAKIRELLEDGGSALVVVTDTNMAKTLGALSGTSAPALTEYEGKYALLRMRSGAGDFAGLRLTIYCVSLWMFCRLFIQ